MYERFTDRAREVVRRAGENVAKRERPRGGPSPIMTVDLLYALAQDTEALAGRILTAAGITQAKLDSIRFGLPTEPSDPPTTAEARVGSKFSDPAKQVLELSLREALSMGHNYIGTEHILLALTRPGAVTALRVLEEFGVDVDAVREAVMRETRPTPKPKAAEPEAKSATDALDEPPTREALSARVRSLLAGLLDNIESGDPPAITREQAEVIDRLAGAVKALDDERPGGQQFSDILKGLGMDRPRPRRAS